MRIWTVIVVVLIAGVVGGGVNALITDNGFVLPQRDQATGIERPGIVGNLVIGGVAALISWALYGPQSSVPLVGGPGEQAYTLTLAQMAGIILAGVSGSRLITAEVDKRALTSTATTLVAEVQVLKGRPSPGVNFSTTAPFKFREDVQKLLNP